MFGADHVPLHQRESCPAALNSGHAKVTKTESYFYRT